MNATQNLTLQQSKERHHNHNKIHQQKENNNKRKRSNILLMVWRISSTHSCHWNEIATSRQLHSKVIYRSLPQAVTKSL
jgi:hypothetical protein